MVQDRIKRLFRKVSAIDSEDKFSVPISSE